MCGYLRLRVFVWRGGAARGGGPVLRVFAQRRVTYCARAHRVRQPALPVRGPGQGEGSLLREAWRLDHLVQCTTRARQVPRRAQRLQGDRRDAQEAAAHGPSRSRIVLTTDARSSTPLEYQLIGCQQDCWDDWLVKRSGILVCISKTKEHQEEDPFDQSVHRWRCDQQGTGG